MSTVSPYLSIMILNGNRLKTELGWGSRKVSRDQTPKALVSHIPDSLDFILGAMGSHGRLWSDGGALPAL